MKAVFILCLFVVAAYGATLPSPIPILRLDQHIREDGADHDFESGNGIKATEDLKVFDGPEHLEEGENGAMFKTLKHTKKSGTYSYTAPSGELISMTYVADDSGFHPVGNHLPTPPPMPEELIKAYAEAAARPVWHEEMELHKL